MRVLRVYHAGRDRAHRARERALSALGVDVTLVVPSSWPDGGAEAELSDEPFPIVELEVRRAGDVNRHTYASAAGLSDLIARLQPDLLDIHEEPVSLAARQWLRAAPPDLPVAMYTAQNVDKRFPPPFAQYETAAYRRAGGLYPCSHQAASVARGKGFGGRIAVLPLGVDEVYTAGEQTSEDPEIRLGLIGRLVPEKGVRDAIRVLADLVTWRPSRLIIVGDGPEVGAARALAEELGVAEAVEFHPWQPLDSLARLYRGLHVVLVPSRTTETWVEQFGRIIIEAQASGAVVAGYASGAIPGVGGEAAVLVSEGDVVELTHAIRRILQDQEAYASRRDTGLAQASRATWPEVARRQLQLYEEVLSRPRRMPLPRRDTDRRRAAVRQFGPTAPLAGGDRPFALPVLRKDAAWTRAAGHVIDTAMRVTGR
ncbi:hypothetical protein DQ237_10410 [Blastococcus sp. TF02-8]|uniref:glycosyltransferase family 4 protein n=1 Tax=Blastococcus sp. TF02-8 TaxID=2250574 RepID=UPI000DEBDD25|nr:glycosyltransferase family 4 protein [Blastococcus sp. TF02-8]RBY96263.1 hypothetical protein DQ237_10410 [Blastococcus sp. TF02-8]